MPIYNNSHYLYNIYYIYNICKLQIVIKKFLKYYD